MKRVIAHWSAGTYNVSNLDKKHYHFIVDGDGRIVTGNHSVSANKRPVKGKYAAHTLNCNTGSIGISLACMHGAKETPFDPGKYPTREVQFEVMCQKIAELCNQYNIPVSSTTVLSHAEVQSNLGIKQRGKWDFTRLAFKPELKGARACGNYMRERVIHYSNGIAKPKTKPPVKKAPPPPQKKQPEPTPVKVPWWKRWFPFNSNAR